jgi:hypothetical protein
MTLLFLLGLNAISLHLRITPSPETSGLALPESSASIRLQAIVSILGWATVIGLGRWLAYV